MKRVLKLVPGRKHRIDWRNVAAWGGGIAISSALWWLVIFYWTPMLARSK